MFGASVLPDFLVRRLNHRPISARWLEPAQFRRALERERMRADRSSSSFALLEFHCGDQPPAAIVELVKLLESRLRGTDEFGEVPGGVGVILPHTSFEAATGLARAVSEKLPAWQPGAWWVRMYPASAAETTAETTVANTAANTAAGIPSGVAATNAPAPSPRDQVSSAELLFAQPLPLWKRGLDVAAASLALVLLSPVLLAAALAIKLTSPGPVLFTQRRTGRGGRPFTIYKLRTMRADADTLKAQLRAQSEQDGPAFKLKNDPRVTPVGKYLRKTCIDELPQLWNVLVGDMTLVGPRPLPCEEADGCTNWQRRRLDVTPGLTCIWQVNSGRERVLFADWMRMDLQYIRGRSLLTDLRLLWKTIVAVVLHRASH